MAKHRLLALFASNVLSLPLNLALSALLLRYLGVAAFGQIAWLSTMLLLLGNITLETLQSFTLAGSPHTHLVGQFIGKTRMLVGILIGISLQLVWIFFGADSYPLVNIFIVAGVLIATMGFIGVIWAELRNREDFLIPNIINRLLQAGVLLVGSALLQYWSLLSVPTTLSLYALASSFTLFSLVSYQSKAAESVPWQSTRQLFSYFKDNTITISAPQVTLILPGFFVAPELLAVLRVALQMANLSLLLPTSLYYIYVPRLVQSFKSKTTNSYITAMRFVRLWGSISLCFAVGAAVLLQFVVAVIFPGVDMVLTYKIFLILSLGNLLATLLGPTNQILSLIGKVEFNFRLTLITVGCLVLGGGFVLANGFHLLYFVALTAATTMLVKIIAHRELKK